MSKILENKQLVHIVSEVVVALGLFYYVSSKFKSLKTYVEDLSHRIDEQEDTFEKLQEKYDNLVNEMTVLKNQMKFTPPNVGTKLH